MPLILGGLMGMALQGRGASQALLRPVQAMAGGIITMVCIEIGEHGRSLCPCDGDWLPLPRLIELLWNPSSMP